MNGIHDIIVELRSKGMLLSAENDKLIIKGPKGVISAELRDYIVENKPEIIRYLVGENNLELRKIENRPHRIPLSYAQERLWFLAELGQSGQYHIPGFLHFDGIPAPEYIKKAFQILVDRHESLRTCFRKENGEAYQLILDHMEVPCEHVMLKDKHAKDPEVTAVTSAFAAQPFDLENGPLFRIIIIELQGRFVIGYCVHHIIADGWSVTILQQELNAIFRAFYEKSEPQLPPMEIQFADYAIWQKKVLSKEKLADKIAHWKQHLSGHQDLTIPMDFPRPESLSGKGRLESLTLNLTKSLYLRDYCKRHQITLFSLLLSGVYVLLKRYCHQDDICVGLPIANRNHKAIEKLIGFFANTVVNRMQMTDDMTLEELIKLSQKELLRAQDYQDVPFSRIVDAVQPARDASKTPLFQVLVNYVNVANQKIRLGTDKSRDVDYEYNTSKFDLNFTFSEGAGETINIGIEYSTDLFMPETIKRLMRHYEMIIENLIRDGSVKLGDIRLETAAESQILKQYNETDDTAHVYSNLHKDLISVPADMADRIAVKDSHGKITYAELAGRSNRLADILHRNGVVKGHRVGICLDRSCDFIIAVLAVLKTGAAYVAIDPHYPDERVGFIIKDAELNCVITDEKNLDLEAFKQTTFQLDVHQYLQTSSEISRQIPESIAPGDAAYIIYTSGSTGKPKGVIQTHRTIDNLSYMQARDWNIHTSEVANVGQFASAGFDVSVQEIFFALKNFQTLVITPHDIKRNPEAYIRFAEENQLNYIFLPTAYLDVFTSEAIQTNASFPYLKRIVVAGEALRITRKVRQFFNKLKHIRLENHYGPTETHVATTYMMEEDADKWRFLPCIGRPVTNSEIYILNKSMNKVPLGGIGELHVSGAGVASGYLNRDAMTAERFVENPYGVGRLYKTGDLGRWLPDGTIDYLGRADQQVKIRGFRVEPGEIEKAILEHPDIDLAAVIVKERNGEKQLVGFYTSAIEVSPGDLRNFLQKSLPHYMIPGAMMSLDEIPYNGSGKVDRHALTEIDVSGVAGEDFIHPETATEKLLAGFWKELLGVNLVAGDANFFELGGHSLLAVKLVSLVSKAMPGSSLKVMDVLKYPVLSAMAKYLDSGKSTEKSSPYILTFIDPGATFIIPGMPGICDGYHHMAVRLKTERGVYGLQMKGFNGEAPLESVEEMAAHNLSQIKEVMPGGKIELYGHSYGGTVIYEMLNQLDRDRYETDRIVFLDSSPHKPAGQLSPASAIALSQAVMWKYNIRNEKLYHEVSRIVHELPDNEWKQKIISYLSAQIDTFEKDFFSSMWSVLDKSMSAAFTPGKKHEHKLTLIVPNASIGILDENAWNPYFNEIEAFYTGGDHFSMITPEYCEDWIGKLNEKGGKTAGKLIQKNY